MIQKSDLSIQRVLDDSEVALTIMKAEIRSVCPSWDEYRRRRGAYRLAIFLFPLWALAGAMTLKLLEMWRTNTPTVGYPIWGIAWLAFIGIAQSRLVLCPCPGCGRPFHCTWVYGSLFNRRCIHCGLPKWTQVAGDKASRGHEQEGEASEVRLWDRELDG